MFQKTYVQDVSDWIKYYDSSGSSNKNVGESTGGIGAERGSTANPVERALPNNSKTLDNNMRQSSVSNNMPGQQVVQQTLAKELGRLQRRRKRKSVCRGKGKKRKASKRKKKTVRRKKKKRVKKQRDLFDE
jgi:hypothetical protein